MKAQNLRAVASLVTLASVILLAGNVVAAPQVGNVEIQTRREGVSKAVPGWISYQGYLVDATDSSAVTGTVAMTFRLFAAPLPGGGELWSEVHSWVQVDNGLFSVLLGYVTPFPAGLFDGSPLWLQMEVDGDVFFPRKPLVSVPYSYRANSAEMLLDYTLNDLDNRWGLAGTADGDWTISGNNMYSNVSGNVGIGTTTPEALLHLSGNDVAQKGQLMITDTGGDDAFMTFYSGGTYKSYFGYSGGLTQWGTADGSDLAISGGNVGIGTTDPSGEAKLHVRTPVTDNFGILVDAGNYTSGTPGSEIGLHTATSKYASLAKNAYYSSSVWQRFDETSGSFLQEVLPNGDVRFKSVEAGDNPISWTTALTLKTNGNVGIGTVNPDEKLHVVGTAKCDVLEITGGSDIAEPFDISGAETMQPGMVVTIDPEHPGMLRVSQKAYDRCVAGVISGAGGVNPGMLMGQKGSPADGTNPVALTGRVYCWADAANGSIQPGDLLTTSDTPGHAMKVTDHTRAHGAVIGKAMSPLGEGMGLVLILVALQ